MPCDPNGTLPGANGRTCPCKTSSCAKPAGRQIPIANCVQTAADTVDECRYGHLDFWYMTFDPGGNAPCQTQTTPPCPWVGTANCAFRLEHVPAGFSKVPCDGVTASGVIPVDRIFPCNSTSSATLPVPSCDTPTIYGWPIDCAVPVPSECACVCSCNVGTLGTYDLVNEIGEGCQSKGVIVTVAFAVPCGNIPGVILCGYGCDDCASSYLGLQITMSTAKNVKGVYGDQNFIYPDPPDPYCSSLVSDPPVPSPNCDAYSQIDSALCLDKCCECLRTWYVVMRKRRTPADGNTCRMAKGKYEIVGSAPCGGGPPYYPCGTGTFPCIESMPSCGDPAAWAAYFANLGLKLEVEIV